MKYPPYPNEALFTKYYVYRSGKVIGVFDKEKDAKDCCQDNGVIEKVYDEEAHEEACAVHSDQYSECHAKDKFRVEQEMREKYSRFGDKTFIQMRLLAKVLGCDNYIPTMQFMEEAATIFDIVIDDFANPSERKENLFTNYEIRKMIKEQKLGTEEFGGFKNAEDLAQHTITCSEHHDFAKHEKLVGYHDGNYLIYSDQRESRPKFSTDSCESFLIMYSDKTVNDISFSDWLYRVRGWE